MAVIHEWEPKTWRRAWTAASGPLAVFVHTPLCGTCKAARRMLEVAGEIEPGLPLVAANLNLMPDLAQTFRIESVPCLLFKRADGSIFKQYRFGSVPEIVQQLRKLI
jgi:thiol-disulfide isomerase/thioredoxin